jgi:hypothetical protein
VISEWQESIPLYRQRKGPGSQKRSKYYIFSGLPHELAFAGQPDRAKLGTARVKQLICPVKAHLPGGKSSAEADLKWRPGGLL